MEIGGNMYQLNDIFHEDNEYEKRAEFANANGYMIKEIEPDEHGRRFQIVEVPPPTEEEELDNLRILRQEECFPIINRGQLWYNTLTTEQLQELDTWYHAWLDVTITKQIPQKPEWLA